jgi:hypothetical protein
MRLLGQQAVEFGGVHGLHQMVIEARLMRTAAVLVLAPPGRSDDQRVLGPRPQRDAPRLSVLILPNLAVMSERQCLAVRQFPVPQCIGALRGLAAGLLIDAQHPSPCAYKRGASRYKRAMCKAFASKSGSSPLLLAESQESQSRSVVTPALFAFSSALIGAELGPQAPLIQVLTPKWGSTHAWRMIQTTRMPKGMRTSIALPPVFAIAEFVFISCLIPILRYLWAKNHPLPKRASTQAMMFARCGSVIW